jgi:hypothetical protein
MRTLTTTLLILATLLIPTTLANASTGCPNEQVRHESSTNPATGQPYSTELPECRAFELVSPAEKNAQHLYGGYTAPDGDAAIFGSKTALPGSPIGGTSAYVARRTPTGWSTTPLAPPNDNPDNQEANDLGDIGSDFSTVFLGDNDQLVPADSDSHFLDLFAVGEGGSLSWISQGPNGGVGAAPNNENVFASEARLGGATTDLSHVVFETTYGKLLPQDTHSYGSEIYDRINQTTTELVGLLPNESVPVCGVSLGEQPGNDGTEAENQGGAYRPTSVASDTVVSVEGTAVFFRSPDHGATACPTPTPPQLYVRIDDEHTLQISAPAAGVDDPHGEQEAHYDYSTPNGDKVFFTTKGALTANANTNNDTSEDLYECEIIETAGKPACALTDLSSNGLADPDGSQVQGMVDASENGEIVYFVAEGQLTSQATSGALNLYVSENGHISYITALGSGLVNGFVWSGSSRNARVTPDGTHLLFSSSASLTGYTTNGLQEIYLYDLSDGSMVCVSCGPPDTTASGEAALGSFPAHGVNAPQANLSDNGETVFFDSPESLTGVDTHGIQNVYEWHDGAVTLISPPGPYQASFQDASSDGSNVFFTTHDVLVGQDQDGGDENEYDARIDGGYPAPPPPAKQCESNTECKGAATSLSTLAPASLTAGTIGNVIPPRAPAPALVKQKALTKAELLKEALTKCKKEKGGKRKSCEKAARKRYAPAVKKKTRRK